MSENIRDIDDASDVFRLCCLPVSQMRGLRVFTCAWKISMKLSTYTIEAIRNCLIDSVNPAIIIIFGSFARGDASENSDIDICVIVNNADEVSRAASVRCRLALRRTLGADGPATDLILLSAMQYFEKKDDPSSIFFSIQNEGNTIYQKVE